ncbi:GNAT family N-acetyltransferase [Henriciella aquimarina]|uniref:hypothetical protein n=1 Tax=Henriciella aquimarina TaxID=545261 RepID=UPI0009FCBEAF|nr:hypothetical protein [Henriciella aquimarina]
MITIRTLKPEDMKGLMSLVAEAGFPARSAEGWRWALFGNPDQGEIAPGLVAERDRRMLAVIGLQTRSFMVNGKPERAINGHTFIASHDGRGAGFALARRALATEGISAVYSLNNNAMAGRLHKKLGLTAWLGQGGRARLEWPVHSVTMAAGVALTRAARKEAIYDWFARREWFARAPRSLERFLPASGPVCALHPDEASDAERLNEFNETASHAHRAAPVRRADVYAWQMADPDAPGRIALLGLPGRNGLDGLMQLAITKPNTFEPADLEIIDLDVRPGADQARVVPELIKAALAVTRRARLSRLRLPFSDRFEPICFQGTGLRFTRMQSHDIAHAAFADPDGTLARYWVPTGFEGDLFFALRLVPPSAHAQRMEALQSPRDGMSVGKQVPNA